MPRICFDAEGEPWAQDVLEERLGASMSDDRFSTYAALNLGYVSAQYDTDNVRLWLRPSGASQDALTKALYWLVELKPNRVALAVYDNGWTDHVTSLDGAINLICTSAGTNYPPRPDYFRDEVDPAKAVQQPKLRALLAFWREKGRLYDPDAFEVFSRERMNDRLFTIGMRDAEPYFDRVGEAVGRRSIANRIEPGTPVARLPDSHYATQTASSYRDAYKNTGDNPTLELVSAYVRSSGRPEGRIEYFRLLLPTISIDGMRFLVGVSIVHTSVHSNVKVL